MSESLSTTRHSQSHPPPTDGSALTAHTSRPTDGNPTWCGTSTHTSTDDEWVCCGVPFDDAELTKDIPAEMLREELFDYNGQLMVGGCRKTFSRRDALKRHLRAHKGVCFGSELAP